MRDVAAQIMKLPFQETRHETHARGSQTFAQKRTWQYDNQALGLEVPRIVIAMEERYERNERRGAYFNETRHLEQIMLTLAVNEHVQQDIFRDEGVKEWSYGLRGERFRYREVGRWRAYTPEGSRIAQAVLTCLTEPAKIAEACAALRAA